jgi:glycosyltransferase involved in cell wall biosynthesis
VTPPAILLGLTGLDIDGGIASVSRCVARALDDETRCGRVARVDRVSLYDDPRRPPPGPAVGVQRLARGSQARFAWQVFTTHRRWRHDLVFFDLVGLARVARLPLPGLPPARYAIFAHGVELTAARRGTRAHALAGADRLLANSEFTARVLAEQHPGARDRIRVVPLCIDPARVAAWQAEAPADPPREPAALIVGRMASAERYKGHDLLIEVWPEVRRAVPGAELWIAGGGDDVPRLQALARARAGDAVHFVGRVSDAELAGLYRRASVYAMPSRREGFGLAWAEAMWFGLPCIGTSADAAAEVIADGDTGRLVPWADAGALARALVELLAHPDAARRMGERGRQVARERFGYPRFRADLVRALELA